jgi:oligosaccharide repeat unit polymerase
MALITSLALLILAIVLYRKFRRWLFPPVLYTLYWSGVIAGTVVFNFWSYTLTSGALVVFVVGGICFVVGGLVAEATVGAAGPQSTVPEGRKRFIQNCIIVYGIVLLLLLATFVDELARAQSILGTDQFALAARISYWDPNYSLMPRYFQSLVALGSVLAYLAAWLYDGSRRAKISLLFGVVGPLSFDVLSFGRSPVVALLLGVLSVLVLRQAVKQRSMLILLALTTIISLAMGFALGKGGSEGPVSEVSFSSVAKSVASYFVGGPLGFSQVMDQPAVVGQSGLSLRLIGQAAKSLGVDIELPDNVLGYYNPNLGNVYTIYFAYWLDYGWIGIIVVGLLAGFLCTFIYRSASNGNPVAGVAFALVPGALLTSAVGDGIFLHFPLRQQVALRAK